MPPTRTLGNLSPVPTLQDEKDTLKRIDKDIERQQAIDAKGDKQERLRLQAEGFETKVTGLLRAAVSEMQSMRDGKDWNGGLYSRYQAEEEKYRNEKTATPERDGEISPHDPNVHLKAGVVSGLFTDNVNTVSAWLVESVLGRGGRPYQIRPKGRKDENDEKTRVIMDLLDSMFMQANLRGVVAEALTDLPKHGTSILRQSWVEETQWLRNDARTWEEQIVRRGPTLEWWRLIDVFISSPLYSKAQQQDAIVWLSRTTLSHLEANERITEMEEKNVQDPAQPGKWLKTMRVSERGRFINLETIRRAQNQQQDDFTDQTDTAEQPDGTSAQENRWGQVSAEQLMDLWEFQGRFPMGNLYRQGVLTDELIKHYGFGLNLQSQGETKGKPRQPKGEAMARLLDAVFWYCSFASSTGAEKGDILVEMRPCPYRAPRNEMISAYFIPAGHDFYGMSSDKLAGDVGDTADQVLNDITAIISNNADPNRVLFRNCLDTDSGKQNTDEKLNALLNGTGETIFFNERGVALNQAIQFLLKPYDASMPNFFNQLCDIYGKRTLSSNLSSGGQATTQTDTLGEAQQQLQAVERRLAEVSMRLSGEQIVRPIVENALNDLDWFMSAAELTEEAKRVAGQKGLDFDTMFPTAQAEGSDARRPLAEEYIVEGTAAAEIQKEVAIQFLLKMAEASGNVPTADIEANLKSCYDLMGLDPEKYFKKTSGPMPPRKIVEMILAGDKPKVDTQIDAMGQMQELQMNRMAWEQIKGDLAAQGHSTEAWEGFIKVLDAYILDVTELANAQQKIQQQQMMQQAMAQASQAKPGKGAGGPGSTKGGQAGDNAPQGPAGVMRGIQNGAGRKAANPPPGSEGPRT